MFFDTDTSCQRARSHAGVAWFAPCRPPTPRHEDVDDQRQDLGARRWSTSGTEQGTRSEKKEEGEFQKVGRVPESRGKPHRTMTHESCEVTCLARYFRRSVGPHRRATTAWGPRDPWPTRIGSYSASSNDLDCGGTGLKARFLDQEEPDGARVVTLWLGRLVEEAGEATEIVDVLQRSPTAESATRSARVRRRGRGLRQLRLHRARDARTRYVAATRRPTAYRRGRAPPLVRATPRHLS